MDATTDHDTLLLPAGTRLVHIGPPKTGTTSVQGAFHACRMATEAQGVHYAGRRRHSGIAVQAVTGRAGFFTEGNPPSMLHWRGLVRDIRAAGSKRVVLSSEFFADATADAIPRIVDDLDPGRIHVVVTLRPLARIVPSQWQQYVQSTMRVPFDAWLDAMFNKPESTVSPSFWRRHRHDRLVERWAAVVGPSNVTVVVLDDGDRERVLRVFERLTGLREGTLVAPPDVTNRSMTLPEIEAVRAFNVAFRDEGLSNALLNKVMHFGATNYMKLRQPSLDEPRIEMPRWATDRAAEIAREMVDAIAASGVRVVGDLEHLAEASSIGAPADRLPPVQVSPEIAGRMAMGVLFASGLAREPTGPGAKGGQPARSTPLPMISEPLETMRIPTMQLLWVILGRARLSATMRLRSIFRRAA